VQAVFADPAALEEGDEVDWEHAEGGHGVGGGGKLWGWSLNELRLEKFVVRVVRITTVSSGIAWACARLGRSDSQRIVKAKRTVINISEGSHNVGAGYSKLSLQVHTGLYVLAF